MNKKTYDWSSNLWLFQHLQSHMIAVQALCNQLTYRTAAMSHGHVFGICTQLAFDKQSHCEGQQEAISQSYGLTHIITVVIHLTTAEKSDTMSCLVIMLLSNRVSSLWMLWEDFSCIHAVHKM